MKLQPKFSLALKIALVSIVGLLVLYTIYSVIGCFVLLAQQPQFVLPNGDLTRSQGFVVEALIYLGIFVILSICEGLLVYFLFFHKRKKKYKNWE